MKYANKCLANRTLLQGILNIWNVHGSDLVLGVVCTTSDLLWIFLMVLWYAFL